MTRNCASGSSSSQCACAPVLIGSFNLQMLSNNITSKVIYISLYLSFTIIWFRYIECITLFVIFLLYLLCRFQPSQQVESCRHYTCVTFLLNSCFWKTGESYKLLCFFISYIFPVIWFAVYLLLFIYAGILEASAVFVPLLFLHSAARCHYCHPVGSCRFLAGTSLMAALVASPQMLIFTSLSEISNKS